VYTLSCTSLVFIDVFGISASYGSPEAEAGAQDTCRWQEEEALQVIRQARWSCTQEISAHNIFV
jgi:hypothetical protein